MKVTETKIPGLLVIEPKVFSDERGFFFESFNEKAFNEATGNTLPFVQDNHSKSVKGVLRGLHYQLPPRAQGKLVRVVQGEVFDVAVDIRKRSPTYGQWVGEILTAENKKQLWIPPGFAHGFCAMTSNVEMHYKVTEYWDARFERSILWSSLELGINWPKGYKYILSKKDADGIDFSLNEEN
jgi:dTDP-4-dehydrorhamnose 3,5-epimerase